MPRTPIAKDSTHRTYQVKTVNHEYVEERIAASRRTFTEVVNLEIAFARTFGLPAQLTRRLDAEAARRGIHTMELVELYVQSEALKMPPPKIIPPEPPDTRCDRTTLAITGPNDAFVLRLGKRLGMSDYVTALDAILSFNRRFGLSRPLFAAITHRANSLDVSVQDVVIEALMREALTLPEVHANKRT